MILFKLTKAIIYANQQQNMLNKFWGRVYVIKKVLETNFKFVEIQNNAAMKSFLK